MRILFIAPRFPLPADTGGKIRTLNILRQLAKQAKIHLVCFSFTGDDGKLCSQLEEIGIRITLIPGHNPGFVKKITQVLFNPLPVSIAKYHSKGMESALIKLTRSDHFDAVHIDHVHMAHYRKCFSGLPRVIDEHNVEYKILQRCARVERSLIKKMIFQNQAVKMKAFEQRQIRDSSACLAVSKEDRDLLNDLVGGRLSGHVIPNGVDTEFFQGPTAKGRGIREENALVFTGSMDWFPNNDAAVYFCGDILPLIWNKNPDIKLYIVGKHPSADLKKRAKGENRIILTGRVDDVRAYVARSKIFVVPLRIGGGTRLKILEAMSMRKAVVSTAIGAEGIDYTEGKNIVLAGQPEDFARKVLALMDDGQTRAVLGNNGRTLVLEKYDWAMIGNTLKGVYERVKK